MREHILLVQRSGNWRASRATCCLPFNENYQLYLSIRRLGYDGRYVRGRSVKGARTRLCRLQGFKS